MRRHCLRSLWPGLWAALAAGCATAAAGNFSITGEVVSDGCPSAGIYLAAKHIFVDPAGGTLVADVVNRTYSLRASGHEVDASGAFEANHCPAGQLRERWLLHGEEVLEGTLDSTWPTPDDCATSCTVQFRIHARRLKDGRRGGD